MTAATSQPGYRFLQPAAVVLFVVGIGVILLVAGDTLGYDFRAYLDAARRLAAGQPLYDLTVTTSGAVGLFQYPPPVAVGLLPLVALPGDAPAVWIWTALVVGSLVAAIAVLPVRSWVRWTVLLVAGLTWPVLYAVKLGQVGPVLLLAFSLAWRWIDLPASLGAAIAAGTLMKLQPVLLVPWALVVGRWRAAAIALGAVVAISLAATVVTGIGAWHDYVTLITRVGAAVATPHAVSPGALALGLGLSTQAAALAQWAAVAAVAAITLHAWFRRDAVASLVVTAIASQVVSPLVWDHYAVVLLLPVALVLDRVGPRAWPIALLPVAGWLPAVAYPALFAVGLVAAWAVGRPRGARGGADAPVTARPAR